MSFVPEGYSFNVTGLQEVALKLRDMPLKMQMKIERKGLKRALRPVLEIARSKARGSIKRSLEISVRKEPGTLVGSMRARVSHWHLVEFGHRMVGHKTKPGSTVASRRDLGKRTRAFPFLRPAFDQGIQQAIAALEQELTKAWEEYQGGK